MVIAEASAITDGFFSFNVLLDEIPSGQHDALMRKMTNKLKSSILWRVMANNLTNVQQRSHDNKKQIEKEVLTSTDSIGDPYIAAKKNPFQFC